jgi:hypothetical protein
LEQLVVVTHPDPVVLEARPIEDVETTATAWPSATTHDGHVLARGVVANDALDAIHGLLSEPVSVALAATEDENGNIDARVCLVLPVDPDDAEGGETEPDEPWRASVPAPPGSSASRLRGTAEAGAAAHRQRRARREPPQPRRRGRRRPGDAHQPAVRPRAGRRQRAPSTTCSAASEHPPATRRPARSLGIGRYRLRPAPAAGRR